LKRAAAPCELLILVKKRSLAPSACIALSLLLGACSNARPPDSANAPPSLSAADQDFIASRHGGM
jgi:hypothetical protein